MSNRVSIKTICAAAIGADAKKQENKEKILALLAEDRLASSGQEELSSSDIRNALGISDRTATRYLDELEKDGKVE